MISLIISILLVVAVLVFLFRYFTAAGVDRVLCDTCNANSPRYCHLSIRGQATMCDDYSPKGGR